jgi:apolipoprotein N-acyltransferase
VNGIYADAHRGRGPRGAGTWRRKPPLENKLVLITPDGQVAWEYFKAHPIPGTEAAMSMTRDGTLRALGTPFGRLTAVICFDADFPQLLAQAGRLRADILLDPSSDWQAIDPWHTQMASFRAIEQGVSLVRQTSLGLSAAVDYEGRVVATLDHYLAPDHVLVSHVPTRGVRTMYSRCGDWFAWASLLGLVALFAVGRMHRPHLARTAEQRLHPVIRVISRYPTLFSVVAVLVPVAGLTLSLLTQRLGTIANASRRPK